MRVGQRAVLPDIPCHGDVFDLQQQFETVVNILNRQAAGATSKRSKLEQKLVRLATEVKTLLQWMSHDVLELAGPLLAVRQELFDFIVTELQQRECKVHPQLQTLRKSLHHQRDQVLAFAGLLDQKLAKPLNSRGNSTR